jgi:hypothetical protein
MQEPGSRIQESGGVESRKRWIQVPDLSRAFLAKNAGSVDLSFVAFVSFCRGFLGVDHL